MRDPCSNTTLMENPVPVKNINKEGKFTMTEHLLNQKLNTFAAEFEYPCISIRIIL